MSRRRIFAVGIFMRLSGIFLGGGRRRGPFDVGRVFLTGGGKTGRGRTAARWIFDRGR